MLVNFVGGWIGEWRVEGMQAVAGEPLPAVTHVAVVEGVSSPVPTAGGWVLRGVTSNERYTDRHERELLVARQQGLARPNATRAALIPIRKAVSWWELPQDDRRAIFEERSRHITRGLEALPAVARRLHHGRDLGEPFDFLTWFEYAPADTSIFDDLVGALRATEEWEYVEREIDIRLAR
jgi:hypothetical protein